MIIQENISLQPYNTFGIDVKAKFFCEITTLDDVIDLIKNSLSNYSKHLFIGSGSNILLCNNFDGLVIKNNIVGIEVVKEEETAVWIKAYSGTVWHDLVIHCVANNWYGIENMSLIPGTVGAAPMQNIGAYGAELKDVFIALEAINLKTATTKIFTKEDCQFGYRESIFKKEEKNNYFIFSVTIQLNKNAALNTSYGDIQKILQEKQILEPTIKDVSDAVIFIRQSKLPNPAELGNAGSFFKNPEIALSKAIALKNDFPEMPFYTLPNEQAKIPAAWLIEQCGWKGKKIGNTGNHAKQALVVVNYGNANGNEIWQHALNVQKSVQEKFGITLQPEVNIIT